ncbi:MAG: flagellar export chaperone FliS, partial [Janthinobacterium lividum]
GGEIANNLDDLYAYMSRQLLMGNLTNSAAKFEEVRTLLLNLRSAWVAIDPNKGSAAPAQVRPSSQVDHTYDALRPNVSRLVKA